MILYTVLLALYLYRVSSLQLTEGIDNHTTIKFDDITTHSGLADIPSPYHLLSFSSFSIFEPTDPALKGLISEHDFNCAISAPNALLGSRPTEDADGAHFQIANSTAMLEHGLRPYFTLQSFYIKPMDAPMPGTVIYVKGLSKKREDPLVWHVEFPSGYHLPFLVKIQEYSGELWNEIYKIEIVANFGYDSLDWEFCIDDLELVFQSIPTQDTGGVMQDPFIVSDDHINSDRQVLIGNLEVLHE